MGLSIIATMIVIIGFVALVGGPVIVYFVFYLKVVGLSREIDSLYASVRSLKQEIEEEVAPQIRDRNGLEVPDQLSPIQSSTPENPKA
jgi:hypothetical protein